MSTVTIDYNLGDDVEATLEFDHQPAEPQTLEEPGCDESSELTSVIVGGIDIISLLDDCFIASLVTDFEAGAIG